MILIKFACFQNCSFPTVCFNSQPVTVQILNTTDGKTITVNYSNESLIMSHSGNDNLVGNSSFKKDYNMF